MREVRADQQKGVLVQYPGDAGRGRPTFRWAELPNQDRDYLRRVRPEDLQKRQLHLQAVLGLVRSAQRLEAFGLCELLPSFAIHGHGAQRRLVMGEVRDAARAPQREAMARADQDDARRPLLPLEQLVGEGRCLAAVRVAGVRDDEGDGPGGLPFGGHVGVGTLQESLDRSPQLARRARVERAGDHRRSRGRGISAGLGLSACPQHGRCHQGQGKAGYRSEAP